MGDESVGKFRQADAVLSLSEDDIFVEQQLDVRVINVEMKPCHPASFAYADFLNSGG